MTHILAIDSSGREGSVALLGDGALLGERSGDSHGDHAARLLGWVAELVEECGVARDAIDLYAGVRGPGSFTGIRIGLGLITGLAMAGGRPSVGVSGLLATAHAACADGHRGPTLIAVAAGRGELYVEGFDLDVDGPGAAWLPAAALAEAEVARHARERGAPILLRAPGAGLAEALPYAPPLAAHAARIAASRAEPATPLYLRAPDAIARPRGRE